MFCSKREEQLVAPKKEGCHERKFLGRCSKMQQQQQHHRHHHHHHHHHFSEMKLNAAPQQKHCQRTNSWWAYKKFAQQPEHFHSACSLNQEAPPMKPKFFFRGMPRKEKCDNMFDFSENYN